MSFYGALARGEPHGVIFFSERDHILDTAGEIVTLFNDIAPGCPNRRTVRERGFEHVTEGIHIFGVEEFVSLALHILRARGALGVDIEHDKAVITVCERDALYGFEGVIKIIRRGGGGIDADADKRILTACAEYVSLFGVEIGDIEPFGTVVIAPFPALRECLGKREKRKLFCRCGGNMHDMPPFLFLQKCAPLPMIGHHGRDKGVKCGRVVMVTDMGKLMHHNVIDRFLRILHEPP